MKKFIYFAMALVLASCGNKGSSETVEQVEVTESTTDDGSANIEEITDNNLSDETIEQEDESSWQAPFEFQVVWDSYNMMNHAYQTVTTYQLLNNGRLKVTDDFQWIEHGAGLKPDEREGEWKLLRTKEFSGKWSTTQISRGEGYQKVYVIDRANWDNSIYLPDDLDYVWHRGAVSSYYDCENYDLDKATKVLNPKKL